LSKKSKNRVN